MLFSPTQQHPIAQKVTILEWVEGMYEEQVFQGDQVLRSPQFASLNLAAVTVLQAGR